MNMEFEKFLRAGKNVFDQATNQEKFKLLILNSQATYLLELARGLGPGQSFTYKDQDSPRNREELLTEATQLLDAATQLDQYDVMTLASRANVLIERNDFKGAEYFLNYAINADPYYIPALFGQAVVFNQKGDIKETLKVYQTIFRIDSDIPNIRVYIAICFHHLGMMKEARASIKRTLEKDSENVDALALSSIMDMNASKDLGLSKEEITKFRSSSNQSLQVAFKLNPKNSTVALEMARRFFEKGQYQKVRRQIIIIIGISLGRNLFKKLACSFTGCGL